MRFNNLVLKFGVAFPESWSDFGVGYIGSRCRIPPIPGYGALDSRVGFPG